MIPQSNKGLKVLSAQDIFVSYQGESKTNKLDGVSVTIAPGEITAIVGPNGSGKSTLIRSLSRVLCPNNGSVLLNGDDLYQNLTARDSAQAISVAPQDTHVAFDFNARELVAMGRLPHRSGWSLYAGESDEDRKAVDQALERAQISAELAERPIMTLSGGERQRVLIARAIVQGAQFILLDEPTSSLDLAHQAALFEQLTHLAKFENKAVMVVLHDLSAAAAIADRMIVLSKGKVLAEGPVKSVLTRDTIYKAYDCDVNISTELVTGRPLISVRRQPLKVSGLLGRSVYVFCGGGGGSEVLRELDAAGADIVVGDVREGDIDGAVAASLGIAVSFVGAFNSISDPTDSGQKAILDAFDLFIFAPSTLGDLNLSSLFTAKRIAESGGRVYTLQSVEKRIIQESLEVGKKYLQQWTEFCKQLAAPPCVTVDALIAVISGAENA